MAEKRVLILYTGGTMGMKHNEQGTLAPAPGYLAERIALLPEMAAIGMPKVELKEYETLIDSSCMGPANWATIATDIENNYLLYDGFVVIMGTDTMAYASSAMSFMLENLGKPVIFTGSIIPFEEVYSDARRNLIVSIIFAASTVFNEVCICFNDKLLRANRTIKIDSTGMAAFDSPNFPPLATMGAFVHEHTELALPQPKGRFYAHKSLDARILVLKLVPGFDDDSLNTIVNSSTSLRGVVLEMYGTGNGPSRLPLLTAIKQAIAKGIIVIAVTQCLRGGVSLETYSLGKDFKDAGVISGGDMTTEACSTKLAYLFGRIRDSKRVERLMGKSIRGEVSPPEHTGKKYFETQELSRLSQTTTT